MAILYLVRHAQAEGNLFRRFHGWYDGAVTPLGMAQITALTQRFRSIPVQAVYSSDLRRAMDTAQAAAEPHRLPVRPTPGLREVSMGVHEDVPFGELAAAYPEDFQAFLSYSSRWAPQGGESFSQVERRMTETILRLALAHPRDTVALFSHSVAIHCFQAAIRDVAPEDFRRDLCPNTGVSCYEIRGDKLHTVFENDGSHLSSQLSGPRPAPLSIRFHPMDLSAEEELYRNARIDAWLQVFPDLLSFDGPGFLTEAREQQLWDPRALQRAELNGQTVGILQLDTLRGARAAVGHIPFLWVRKDLRRKGVGAMLMGQAVSSYRAMGRSRIRLQCSPANRPAQQFYYKMGFFKAGKVPGARGELDLLEKPL